MPLEQGLPLIRHVLVDARCDLGARVQDELERAFPAVLARAEGVWLVKDQQVVGIEVATDVVDSDRQDPVAHGQQLDRRPEPADQHALSFVAAFEEIDVLAGISHWRSALLVARRAALFSLFSSRSCCRRSRRCSCGRSRQILRR